MHRRVLAVPKSVQACTGEFWRFRRACKRARAVGASGADRYAVRGRMHVRGCWRADSGKGSFEAIYSTVQASSVVQSGSEDHKVLESNKPMNVPAGTILRLVCLIYDCSIYFGTRIV